jgi:tetratricopeptide (TPR) repeat protein
LLADRLTPTGITGALKQLHDWLPMATTAATQTMLQRDKADFLARLNRIDVALETAQTALRLASQSNDAAVIGMTQFTYAVVLTQAGRAQDALPLLRTEDLGVPIQNMHEAFQWCRALAALRERDAAEKWLCRAREMIETEGLTAYRETTNELAKLL